MAGLRLRERVVERAQVRVAAHEAAEAARAGDVEARARRAEPAQLEDGHGPGDALHVERAEVVEREVARDEARGGAAQVAGVRLRERFHALREAHRVALRGVVHAQVVADLADHDLARVEAHARREAEAVAALHLARVALELARAARARRSRRAAHGPRGRWAPRTAP